MSDEIEITDEWRATQVLRWHLKGWCKIHRRGPYSTFDEARAPLIEHLQYIANATAQHRVDELRSVAMQGLDLRDHAAIVDRLLDHTTGLVALEQTAQAALCDVEHWYRARAIRGLTTADQ